MGVGAQWRTAHRAERRSGCCHRNRYAGLSALKGTYARLATVVVLFLVWVSLLYLPGPFTPHGPPVSTSSPEVTILIWTHPFGQYRTLPNCFALYGYDGCTLTDDDSAYPLADAVIIHHREVANGNVVMPPEPRPSAQKWIWLNYESPTHTPYTWRFDGVFNLTMSYRIDSDIFLPYGYLVPREREGTGLQSRFVRPLHAPSRSQLLRPRLLAWVISNWSENQERVEFYELLRQYIRVDVYGNAGRPLPDDTGGPGGVVRLVAQYQFYLALENSQHTDYITEKLWNAVLAGAIPVVLGPTRQNYERFLPPEAFIHVDDFPTVRELARYLIMLRRKPARLRRHLDWREKFSIKQTNFWADIFCAACRVVKRTKGRTSVVTNLSRWFNS